MMIFIGLILLTAFLVGTINGGWFVETFKETKSFTKKKLEELDEEEQIKYSIKILVKVFSALVFAILMSILNLIFLIGALGVDVVLVPTIALLSLFVYNIVRVSTSKKYRDKINNRSEEDKKTKARWSNGIYVIYVLYILVLLVF